LDRSIYHYLIAEVAMIIVAGACIAFVWILCEMAQEGHPWPLVILAVSIVLQILSDRYASIFSWLQKNKFTIKLLGKAQRPDSKDYLRCVSDKSEKKNAS
jgi:hypothetical protein